MSRRKRRSGWAHPLNLNRNRRRWRRRLRAPSLHRRLVLEQARLADADEELRGFR